MKTAMQGVGLLVLVAASIVAPVHAQAPARRAGPALSVQNAGRAHANGVPSSGTTERVTLRNFDPAADAFVWFAEDLTPLDSGFVFGTNYFEDRAKATAFALPAGVGEALLIEVRLWFAFKRSGLANQTYALEVLEGTPGTGPTGTPLYSETFALADVNADDDPETAEEPMVYTPAEPVLVGTTFFVSIDFGSYGRADWANAALLATDLLGQRIAEVWEQWADSTWHNVSEAWFADQGGNDGWHLWIEADVETETGVAVEPGDAEVPRAVVLAPNYPNPFNPATILRFALPAPAPVRLDVVDPLGRTVSTLVEGPLRAGVHTTRFDARTLPSGVYVARLRAGNVVQTRKMVLLR